MDHHEKMLLDFPRAWRAAKCRFMTSTQVTPFENHHSLANWPLDYNPSIFFGDFWPLKPDTDPLRGWDIATINKNNGTEGADNDIYGKMFYYVRDLFKRFILKLRTLKVTFHVLPRSGYDFAEETSQKFDRIETGTLADEDQIGVRTVVTALSPLLKAASINPHATMITIHPGVFDKIRDAFPCPRCDPNRAERVKRAVELTERERALLDAYMPLRSPDPINWVFTAAGWQRRDARWLFRDPAAAWELYKDIYEIQGVAEEAGLAMRATHRIVDEWILRLKDADRLNPDGSPTAEAKWNFDALFATGQTTGCRYVEWRQLEAGEKERTGRKVRRARRGSRGDRGSKRHEAWHEKLSEKEIAALMKKGSELERWMGKDNCENWTPY